MFKSVSRLLDSDRLQGSACNGPWGMGPALEAPWVDYGLTHGLIKNVARSRRFRNHSQQQTRQMKLEGAEIPAFVLHRTGPACDKPSQPLTNLD